MSIGRRSHNRAERERGGVAVTVVAFFLGSSVILGMLAISVDLGNLTFERRQVQNGADATSLALASECAADAANCDPTQVEDLLGANSYDTAGQYRTDRYTPGVCARGTVDQVGPLDGVECVTAGDINDLAECPELPDWLAAEPAIPYIETYAATETATGDELFLPFSRALVGGSSGDAGTSACARAAWGIPVGHSASLPLTISTCEWDLQTNSGDDFVANGPTGAKPGYGASNPWPDPSREIVIQQHDPGDDESDCDWNGKDTSGGFGWLDSTSCETEVSDDDWVHIKVGASVPNDCKPELPNLHETVIDIPIFDCLVGDAALAVGDPPTTPVGVCDPTKPDTSGNNTWYHLAGWAKFYVSGYSFPGNTSGGSSLPGGYNCSGSEKCLTGWFVTGTISDAPSIAPPGDPLDGDFGVVAIKPAG